MLEAECLEPYRGSQRFQVLHLVFGFGSGGCSQPGLAAVGWLTLGHLELGHGSESPWMVYSGGVQAPSAPPQLVTSHAHDDGIAEHVGELPIALP